MMPWRFIARSEADVAALDQDLFDFVQAQHLSLVIQAVDAKTLKGSSLSRILPAQLWPACELGNSPIEI
jgi:hypothetical protein